MTITISVHNFLFSFRTHLHLVKQNDGSKERSFAKYTQEKHLIELVTNWEKLHRVGFLATSMVDP